MRREAAQIAGMTIVICVTLAAATYLISTDSPWWAMLILLIGLSVEFRASSRASE